MDVLLLWPYFVFNTIDCIVLQCVRLCRSVEFRIRIFHVILVYVYMFYVHIRILNNVVFFLCKKLLFESRQKTTKNVFVWSLVNEEKRQNKEISRSQSRRSCGLFRDYLFEFQIWISAAETYSRFISLKFGLRRIIVNITMFV